MMKFYSWKDVDRFIQLKKPVWIDKINAIEVYPSTLILYSRGSKKEIFDFFHDLLGSCFKYEDETLVLDTGKTLDVLIESSDEIEKVETPIIPLFKNIIYRNSSYPELSSLKKFDNDCPIIAFHSYKGGVGRTLTLIAFAKAWGTVFENQLNNKLLIIDSDIEAPGLTNLQAHNSIEVFSYLDLLALIQDSDDIDEIVEFACKNIVQSTMALENDIKVIEHYFIPTYRYEQQLLDIYANPESITNGKNKEYILSEVLYKIGLKLGVSAVLVDLRTGISEFSSTLLFDPRVKKYLVTSTSMQSIKGTKMVLSHILKGLKIQEDSILPQIILSMVPSDLDTSEIINSLSSCYDVEDEEYGLTDNVVVSLEFASELIHLTTVEQIQSKLNDREMYNNIVKFVRNNFLPKSQNEVSDNFDRKSFIESVNNFAEKQITADSASSFEILVTSPIRALKRKYATRIPSSVIMGAKGSGKTFLFRKLINNKDWFSFCASLDKVANFKKGGYILPIICPKNDIEMIDDLSTCIENINKDITGVSVSKFVWKENYDKLTKFNEADHTESEWNSFWENLIVNSINKDSVSPSNLGFVNEGLVSANEQIVIVVDGLEEIFKETSKRHSEKIAVSTLCQNIINNLSSRYSQIGAIVFLRKDLARESIEVNFAQFEQSHKDYELKWSFIEALRLALWIVSQAQPKFLDRNVDVENAIYSVIESNLERFWGLKLGKPTSNEAFTSRWIFAALSDFNGMLQARDIIRFLKYATENSESKVSYNDRIIMPGEIRSAVASCNQEKVSEIEQEIHSIKPIFEKLSRISSELKILPFTKNSIELTVQEEKTMQQEGYLRVEGDNYYIPEIIRHALGFRYAKGARPKVLSLTLGNSKK